MLQLYPHYKVGVDDHIIRATSQSHKISLSSSLLTSYWMKNENVGDISVGFDIQNKLEVMQMCKTPKSRTKAPFFFCFISFICQSCQYVCFQH